MVDIGLELCSSSQFYFFSFTISNRVYIVVDVLKMKRKQHKISHKNPKQIKTLLYIAFKIF